MRDRVAEKASAVVVFGESAEEIASAWKGSVDIEIVDALTQALQTARSKVIDNGTILFSPACTSFDQFNSYAERGKRFKELVKEMQTIDHG